MKLPFASFLLSLTLASAGLALHSFSNANVGPPAVCFPFEIGDEETIPDEFKGSLGAANLTDRVATELSSSDRTLFHMETLRCAAWAILSSDGDCDDGYTKDQLGHELVSRLRWNLVEGLASPEPLTERKLGLLWFDLAFVQGAMSQALRFDKFGCEEAMIHAMDLLEDDAAAQFGCAVSMWEFDQFAEVGFYPRLQQALLLESRGGADPDLLGNVLTMGKQLIGAETRDELVAKIDARIAGN